MQAQINDLQAVVSQPKGSPSWIKGSSRHHTEQQPRSSSPLKCWRVQQVVLSSSFEEEPSLARAPAVPIFTETLYAALVLSEDWEQWRHRLLQIFLEEEGSRSWPPLLPLPRLTRSCVSPHPLKHLSPSFQLRYLSLWSLPCLPVRWRSCPLTRRLLPLLPWPLLLLRMIWVLRTPLPHWVFLVFSPALLGHTPGGRGPVDSLLCSSTLFP